MKLRIGISGQQPSLSSYRCFLKTLAKHLRFSSMGNLTMISLFTFAAFSNPVLAGENKPAFGSLKAQTIAAAEFYVSPTGKSTGDGSLNNPWDLQTALNQPSAVTPGSTVWLKPGTYKGTFISLLSGTAASPILVKPVPGGRAIIDGSLAGQAVKNVTTFLVKGAYTWYSGFEVTNSDPQRIITQSGSNPQERRGEGVYVLGVGIKIINLIIYDTGEGLSCWTPAENNEYYGNLIFNNGWFAPDREHGHGIYAQNNTGTKSYIDNIVLNNFSYGWQFYGSPNASLKNFYLEGNVMLNDKWLIGGSTPAENVDVNTNFTYKDTVEFGYTNNVTNSGLTLRNNVFSSPVLLSFWKNVTATNNTFYTGFSYGFPITLMFNGAPDVSSFNFNNNTYYWSNPPSPYQPELAINWVNFPLPDNDANRRGNFFLTQWKQMGKDVNSTMKYFKLIDDRNYAITGSSVYVRKNKYDAKKANIIIYNYDKLDNIPVDVSGILSAGDSYELHNVQNYFGDVITGTYSGGQLSVPMNNHTVAKPLGYNAELGKNTLKEFGTFVLIKTTGGTITPTNAAPVANAGTDVTIKLPVNSAVLNGSQSTDADGSISTYNWTKLSGPSSFTLSSTSTSSVTVSNLVQGVYSFRLTVTDNKGATASDDVIVTVNAAAAQNQAPVANAGTNSTIQLPSNSATLSAVNSVDADGTIAKYDWTKIAGPSSFSLSSPASVSTPVSNLTEGVYTFRVTITDNIGATASADVSVTVLAASTSGTNLPPVAKAGPDVVLDLSSNYTTLNATGSYDQDGTIATYNWTKVSGPGQFSAPAPTSSLSKISDLALGTYVFTLTVADNKGATSSDDVSITVNTAGNVNKAPVANAGSDISIQLPTNAASLSGNFSSDADGTIAGYNWTKISGPVTFTMSSSSTVSTQLSNLVAGTYVFRLTVTDNLGAVAYDDVSVNIAAQAVSLPVADAGVTENIPVGQATVLHGEKSVAAAGIKSYQWTKTAGPAQYELLSPNSSMTWIRNMVQGTYVYRMTITDNNGNTSSDDVIITVFQNPTVAVPDPVVPTTSGGVNVGSDLTIQLPINSAFLQSTQTVAADRYVASYKWLKIAGPAQYFITSTNTANTTMNYLVAGNYTFRLTVTDNKGDAFSDDVNINVLPAALSSINGSPDVLNELEIQKGNMLTIYPNPVSQSLLLNWNSAFTGNARINIVDLNGKKLKTIIVNKSIQVYKNSIDVSALKQGIYLLEIITAPGKTFTQKFLKN